MLDINSLADYYSPLPWVKWLADGDFGGAGDAGEPGGGEGEGFVELFAEGGGESAVADSMDIDDAAAFVAEIVAESLAEVTHLVVERGPFGNAFAARNALEMQVDRDLACCVLMNLPPDGMEV